MDDLITVYLNEEYGYRQWVWETGMTRDQLIEWWTVLETVEPYFFDATKLPGKLIEAWYGEEGLVTADNYDDAASKAEGDNIPRDPSLVVPYETMRSGWKAHLHMDDDSWLRHEESSWSHKGYRNTTFITGA